MKMQWLHVTTVLSCFLAVSTKSILSFRLLCHPSHACRVQVSVFDRLVVVRIPLATDGGDVVLAEAVAGDGDVDAGVWLQF